VQVVDVDHLHAQALERGFGHPPGVAGGTVHAIGQAELGGQHRLLPAAADGLADQDLVGVRAVGFGAVEQGDAPVQGPVDGGDGLGLVPVLGPAVIVGHGHAAQADGPYGQTLRPQQARFHDRLSPDDQPVKAPF